MSDEAFHEIQLNGKQLVFLFMTATVVAVVIFLCGVMVGRGVRAQQVAQVASLEASTDPTADAQPAAEPSSAPAPGAAAAGETLSYPERLAEPAATPETLNEPPPRATAAQGGEPAGVNPPEPEPRRTAERSSVSPDDGFTVQVAAVKERREAETIVNRLTKRGYAAYVTPPASGAPRVYRVRVGKYRDRRDAESIAARLEKEEQFKPWITR